jgi:RHS repeat-associated protein
MRIRSITVALTVLWLASERDAMAQLCPEQTSCELDVDNVSPDWWDEPTPSNVPQANYHNESGAANLGVENARSHRASISLTSAECGGDELGATIPAVSVVELDADALAHPAECDGTESLDALLNLPPSVVPLPNPQGVPQTTYPDGTGSVGESDWDDPVDSVTGEFVHKQIDLDLPGFGVPFHLIRTYRSRVDFVGTLGPAWDHNYNQRLVDAPRVEIGELAESSCGPSMLLSTGEGTSIRFNEISDTAGIHSYWSSAALLTLTGTDGPAGITWNLRAPDGTVRHFDERGLLVRWVDANDIGLTLTWSGDDATARLDLVTDSAEREIQFEYDGSGRLAHVILADSQLAVDYAYDDNGALQSAHGADGHGESYEYDVDPWRPDADWVPESQLRAGCAAACARTDDATCNTGGACDEPVATALQQCFAWVDGGYCADECHGQCFEQCSAGPGADNDALPCDAYCENDPAALPHLEEECQRVWDEEGAKEICQACDDTCGAQASDVCYQLAQTAPPPGDGTQWDWTVWQSACHDSLTACCADGSGCASGSCNSGDQCEHICEQAFFGNDLIDTTCMKPCYEVGEHDPPPPLCPIGTPRFGCLRGATDACKAQCGDDCAEAQCAPACRAECTHSSCVAMDFDATCNDTCTTSCIEAGRAPGPDGGPRYGRPRDLNFNLLSITDGAGRRYVVNSYEPDVWSPRFDTVTEQQFGEYTPKIARWDLIAGPGGPAPARLPAWAEPLIEPAQDFEPVEICPYTCPAPRFPNDWDEAVVPISATGDLQAVFVAGTVTSPITGFPVARQLSQQVGPTLVKFSTNAQGAVVGVISRRSSTTNYFATTSTTLPITLNDGESVTLTTSRTGAVSVSGTATGKSQLLSMGSMTLFTNAAKWVQAYPGSPTEILKATSGTCTAPFTFQRISATEIELEPATACAGELWVTPVGGRYPDQAAADQFPSQGLGALSTTGFHASTLSPTRDGAIWRQGIDGRRVRETPPTGAGITDAGNVARSQYTATPMFSAPTTTSGLGEPLFVFHHVPADYRLTTPPPPPSDDPWTSLDYPATGFTLDCDPDVPGSAIRGSGVRPTQATAVTDFHGARWTVYADEHNNVLRKINHETGAVWSYNYDPIGQLTGIEEPSGARTCLLRDIHGNVTRRADIAAQVSGLPTPEPIVQDFRYSDANSSIIAIGDPRTGAWLTTVLRDAAGNPVRIDEAGTTTASFTLVGGAGADRFQIGVVTRPGNAVTTLAYDAGTIASITLDQGGAALTADQAPDEAGRIRSRTGALGLNQTWSYDNDGPLLRFIEWTGDGHTGRQTFERDTDGQVSAIRIGTPTADRLRTELTYDVTGSLTQTKQIALDGSASTSVACQDVAPGDRVRETVSPEGIRTRYTRDGEGHVTQIIAGDLGPSSRAWDDGCLDHPTSGTGQFTLGTFEYDLAGALVSSTDERGRLTTITRDGFERPVIITRPDGTQVRRGYDALGNVVWEALYSTSNQPSSYRPPSWADGGLQAAVTMVYDARNRLHEIHRWHFTAAQVAVGDGDSTTIVDYDDVAHTVTTRDDAGYSWIARYDAAGRLVEERAPDSTSRTYSYPDPRTVLVTEPRPGGTTTSEQTLTTWGAVASSGPRVGSTFYPLATMQFDELLRPTGSTSLTGAIASVSYDALGQVTGQLQTVPGGTNETVTIGYDRDGRPRTRTSTAGGATTGTWTWSYDALGRTIDAVDPGGGHTHTTYILGSSYPSVVTDPRGVQLQHSWATNANELFLNAVDPAGPDVSLTYVWDGRGNLTSTARTDEGSTAVTNAFTFDSLGDKIQETDNVLGSAWTRTTNFDGRGLPTRTFLNTSSITRTFDTLGRLATVTWGSESPLATYAYSGFDYRLSRTLQNGIATSYGYDTIGRLASQADVKSGTTLASFTWQIPLDGVPRRSDFHRGAAADNTVFTVDAALRQIDEDTPSTATFTLSPTAPWATSNTTASGTLNAQNWKYTLDGRGAWSRRVRGTSGTTDYLRDARDALTRIGTTNTTLDARGAITNDGSLQAVYDALGQARVLTSGTKVRTYLRDALGRVVRETNEAGQVTNYAWDGATRIVRQRPGGTVYDITVDGADLDEHIATITGTTKQFVHQDRVGSVYMLSGATGAATEWTSYTAYGEPTLRNAAGAVLTNTAVNAQFGFNGLPQDYLMGVVDMRARTYRPLLGRFLSPDPLGLVDGTNRFAFVGGRPTSLRDPFGLDSRSGSHLIEKFDPNDVLREAEHLRRAGPSGLAGAVDAVIDGLVLPVGVSGSMPMPTPTPGRDLLGSEIDPVSYEYGRVWGLLAGGAPVIAIESGIARLNTILITNDLVLAGPAADGATIETIAVDANAITTRAEQLRSVTYGSEAGDASGQPVSSQLQYRVARALNLSTAGKSADEVASMTTYAQRVNAWLQQAGTQEIRSTQGALATQARAAARAERIRAARAGTPYRGQAGHVPDAAISGMAIPPAGWLDMLGISNSACGGVLGSRIGNEIDIITIDGVVP